MFILQRYVYLLPTDRWCEIGTKHEIMLYCIKPLDKLTIEKDIKCFAKSTRLSFGVCFIIQDIDIKVDNDEVWCTKLCISIVYIYINGYFFPVWFILIFNPVLFYKLKLF